MFANNSDGSPDVLILSVKRLLLFNCFGSYYLLLRRHRERSANMIDRSGNGRHAACRIHKRIMVFECQSD